MAHVIVRVDYKQMGQPRPYADHVFEATLTLDGDWYGKRPDFPEAAIKKYVQTLVHGFVDGRTPEWHEPRLKSLTKREPHIWDVTVIQPFLD